MPGSWRERAAFHALLPAIAWQGLRLRRTALRAPAAAGPAHGVVGRGPLLRLLGLGDSIIAGVGIDVLANALPGRTAAALARHGGREVHWRAAGASGLRARQVAELFAQQAVHERLDVVLVSVGVNDVTGIGSTRRWQRDLARLLDAIHAAHAGALLVLAGLPPMDRFPLLPQPLRAAMGIRARTFDAIARELAAARDWVLHHPTTIDPERGAFAADGFHPGPQACARWAESLAQAVLPRLRGPGG
jgi:lysophospholipase L1-like esterase